MAFIAKIMCGRCGRIVKVAGKIWQFRLRHSHKDANGAYYGWHCDACADAIERGADY